uniref:26S proteasome non-ATPase regulatory subunit 3-like n=1 Tax=Styela clava TaxID=7725 RepID=UPI001939F56E|nr:26S proteasome non-ATPase regulatory subunit 3-like [Styela clava]
MVKGKRASKASTKDVEMKEVEKKEEEKPEKDEIDPKEKADKAFIEDFKEQLRLLDRSVTMKEPRHAMRVMRSIPATRRRLNPEIFHQIISLVYNGREATDNANKEMLLSFIDEPMETATKQSADAASAPPSRQAKSFRIPETDIYIHLLVLIYVVDKNSYDEAVKLSTAIVTKLVSQNRRSLDSLAAKCYFYYSRAYEMTNRLEDIRGVLHSRLRTATLNHDQESQSVLLNLLLRNYLHYNLYDQAEKLASKSTFPETSSNNEWARFLYYTGRIKAIQLEYSEAHQTLLSALRKAPQATAVGFKQTVTKLLVTVELLLGEIPERAQFKKESIRGALIPYFELTQAVRTGDLKLFNENLEKHGDVFRADRMYTLILRVRHNVIKTGVRQISVGYSRIFLTDAAKKLQLDSAEEAEFIIAKAIKDGVIEAEINHEEGYVRTRDTTDVYGTREPQKAFHNRIEFCLDIYRNSVMAMRFPPKSYHADLESAEERRERELQDIEFAKEVAEEDDEYP